MKRVLVCPLNWGLGHATRCVPIIHQLIEQGHQITIVSDGYPLQFLRQEFPDLSFIELESYPVRYSSGKSQVSAILKVAPKILKAIRQEHIWLKELLKKEKYDLIISDNRFGLWNATIESVYITHQLMVKMPKGLKFLEPLAWRMHRTFINRYDECRIPDTNGNNNLSGDLSHKYKLPKNATFTDTLSRFSLLKDIEPDAEFETVAVISGLEPQRSLFEENLINRFKSSEEKTLIIQGQPQAKEFKKTIGNLTIISHLDSSKLASHLSGAKKIICRSGYSTIMDLAALDCLHKAEFIPTPGQTEQEYLAEYLSKKKLQ